MCLANISDRSKPKIPQIQLGAGQSHIIIPSLGYVVGLSSRTGSRTISEQGFT